MNESLTTILTFIKLMTVRTSKIKVPLQVVSSVTIFEMPTW